MSEIAAKLLPCPFCGHDDQLYPSYAFPGDGPCLGIDCLRCGIDFTPRQGMDVFEAWNKRAPDTASQARVKVLEEALESIASATDADDPDSYRSDDREGCLDTVHSIARNALKSEGEI